MFTFGLNDWVRYGWTEELNCNYNLFENLYIDFSKTHITSVDKPINSALYTVNEIVNNYPAPYNLFCSGGIDSQSMLYSWILSTKKFEVFFVRYTINDEVVNYHDYHTLGLFCKKFKIDVNFLDLNIIDFLENGLREVAILYNCSSPHICTHIKISELVPHGTVIFSGESIGKGVPINFAILGLARYSNFIKLNSQKRVIPFFFLETPQIAYSFKVYNRLSKKRVKKVNLYLEHDFDIILPEKKFTGFEKVKEYYDNFQHRVPALDKLKFALMESKRPFDLLFRYPYDINKIRSNVVQLLKEEICPII